MKFIAPISSILLMVFFLLQSFHAVVTILVYANKISIKRFEESRLHTTLRVMCGRENVREGVNEI